MNQTSFTTSNENRYFEDCIPGSVHEFGAIELDQSEIVEFGKRFVPLSYHVDPAAAKTSIYGGLIASGWHTAAVMMRLYSDHYLSKIANLGSPDVTNSAGPNRFFPAIGFRF